MDVKCIKVLQLLDVGACCINQANELEFSALAIFKSRLIENYYEIFPLIHFVPPLKCRCAIVIRQNKISLERFPSSLSFAAIIS